MTEELIAKIDEQQKKIDAIYVSVERLRKYFMWTLIITVVTIVLPIVAIIAIMPWFMKTLTTAYGLN